MTNNEFNNFLDSMQKRGNFNMFHAPRLLVETFDITKREAMKIVTDYISDKTVEQ
tara:strand:- start:526 stop:690 length:165 start_codon:yes stop_codon:yes gene_type:complete